MLMTLFQSVAGPGAYGGTILSSVSRQRLIIWSSALWVVIFVSFFIATWHHLSLTGAVIAYGLALLFSYGALMAIALKTAPIFPSIAGTWFKAALVQIAVGAIALWWMPLAPLPALITWAGGLAVFVLGANYDLQELRFLARMFIPGFARLSPDGSQASILEGVTKSDPVSSERRAANHF